METNISKARREATSNVKRRYSSSQHFGTLSIFWALNSWFVTSQVTELDEDEEELEEEELDDPTYCAQAQTSFCGYGSSSEQTAPATMPIHQLPSDSGATHTASVGGPADGLLGSFGGW